MVKHCTVLVQCTCVQCGATLFILHHNNLRHDLGSSHNIIMAVISDSIADSVLDCKASHSRPLLTQDAYLYPKPYCFGNQSGNVLRFLWFDYKPKTQTVNQINIKYDPAMT